MHMQNLFLGNIQYFKFVLLFIQNIQTWHQWVMRIAKAKMFNIIDFKVNHIVLRRQVWMCEHN